MNYAHIINYNLERPHSERHMNNVPAQTLTIYIVLYKQYNGRNILCIHLAKKPNTIDLYPWILYSWV